MMKPLDLRYSFRLLRLSSDQVEAVKAFDPRSSFRPSIHFTGHYVSVVRIERERDFARLLGLAEDMGLGDSDCDFFLSAAMRKPSFVARLPEHVTRLIWQIGVGGITLSFTYSPPVRLGVERETVGLDCLLSFSCQFFHMTSDEMRRVKRFCPGANVNVSRKYPDKYVVLVELEEGCDYSWIGELVEDLGLGEDDFGFLFSVSTEYDTRIYDVPMYVVNLVRSVGKGRLGFSITVEGTTVGEGNGS